MEQALVGGAPERPLPPNRCASTSTQKHPNLVKHQACQALAFLVGIICSSVAGSEIIGNVESSTDFPNGAPSFADVIIDYSPNVSGRYPFVGSRSAQSALGLPDWRGSNAESPCFMHEPTLACSAVALGEGGSITLEFREVLLSGSDDDRIDLWVFEVGTPERVLVELSEDGATWVSAGTVSGTSEGLDIDAAGFDSASRIAFVRLTDDPNQTAGSRTVPGAEIDAVGAVSSVRVPAAQPSPGLDLTDGYWQVDARDVNGTTWNDTTLVFTEQTSDGGAWSLKGHFHWRGNNGSFGMESFTGTLRADRTVTLSGVEILPPARRIITSAYDFMLSDDGERLENGRWSGAVRSESLSAHRSRLMAAGERGQPTTALTGKPWRIGSDTGIGTALLGSTLQIDSQVDDGNGWRVTGRFQWTSNGGATGGERVAGWMGPDGTLRLVGSQLLPPVSGIRQTYRYVFRLGSAGLLLEDGYWIGEDGDDLLTTPVGFERDSVPPQPARPARYGVTVITHGFQFTGERVNTPDWVRRMGVAILRHRAQRGTLWELDAGSGSMRSLSTPETCGVEPEQLPCDFDTVGGEKVVLVNWRRTSNNGSPGFHEEAGHVLFSALVGGAIGHETPILGDLDAPAPIHFIGHSFGTVVNSEAVQRLGHFFPHVSVEQVTTLDPHDFDQGPFGGADDGVPNVYPWDNIRYLDNYYQLVGGGRLRGREAEGSLGHSATVPTESIQGSTSPE